MFKELARLAVGLVITGFHRQIADYILIQEQAIGDVLSRRGWDLPSFPSSKSAHDLYFCLGVFVCLVSMARLWLVL